MKKKYIPLFLLILMILISIPIVYKNFRYSPYKHWETEDIARVQLWPDKTLILFYAPSWWMRLALPCTPFTYEDSMAMIREKLGRKKTVVLPAELIAPPKVKEPKAAKAKETKTEQLSFADVPAPAEESYTEPEPEAESGFVSLADVLEEIKENEAETPPEELQ